MFFRLSRLLLIFSAYLSLCSCTLLSHTPDSLNADIDRWLENNQYNKIEYALKSIADDDSRYSDILLRKTSIKSRKQAYIDDVSATAKKLKRDNQWGPAIATYDTALINTVNAPRLVSEKKQLIEARDKKINKLKKELLIQHAKSLVSYKQIYSQLTQLIPEDNDAQLDISGYRKNKIDVAAHLKKCGELANTNKQFNLAIECFSLSQELHPNRHKLAHIIKLEADIKNDKIQQRYARLLANYKIAYNSKEYNNARTHLNTLLKLSPGHKQAKHYLKELNSEVDRKIQDMLASGKYLYSQNKIHEALNVWQQAQRIEPENEELQQLIYRTEKVSKKIETLELSQ